MKGLHEILTTKVWMIDPPAGDAIRHSIMDNMKMRLPFEKTHFVLAQVMRKHKDGNYRCDHLMYEDDEESWNTDQNASEESDDSFICCVRVDGPVTRNGDACSYGSKDHRDIILQCVKEKQCHGILFYLNTPGGSSAAIKDYKFAINEARKNNLPVVAFVDGMAASAGMYIAALCDERYFMNPSDEVGSIGTYAAWFSLKDGEKDEDGYTYHEVYDPDSYDKNKWYRDALDGDTKLLVDDLKRHGAEFRADVKAGCPNVKEEHIHGKMFRCSEVTGILVDGQKSYDECLQRVDDLYREKHQPGNNDNATETETAVSGSSTDSSFNYNDLSIIKIADMNKKYVTIASLCGVTELHASDEGVFLNAPLVENFNANIVQSRKAYEDKIAKAEQDGKDALETQKNAYEAKMADLKKQLDEKAAALSDLQGKLDEQAKAIEKHTDELKAKDDVIAERDQTIADKDAQIKQLTGEPGEAPEAGASPSDNGAGVQCEGFACEVPQWDDSLTPAENKARMDEYDKKMRSEAYGG